MNKICTSIEQSKKLIELGISVDTADMFWTYDFVVNYINGLNVILDNFKPEENDIPAWSLSALLELIPPYLGEFKDGIDFVFSKAMNGKWYSAHYTKINNNGLVSFSKTIPGDTAIDAAFEMVCWLRENNKI